MCKKLFPLFLLTYVLSVGVVFATGDVEESTTIKESEKNKNRGAFDLSYEDITDMLQRSFNPCGLKCNNAMREFTSEFDIEEFVESDFFNVRSVCNLFCGYRESELKAKK